MSHIFGVLLLLAAGYPQDSGNDGEVGGPSGPQAYPHCIVADAPVAYWRFGARSEGGSFPNFVAESGATALRAEPSGSNVIDDAGPGFPRYPLLDAHNRAIRIPGKGGWLKVKDPGADSAVDFRNGDSITLEAWVNPEAIDDGRHWYVLGKGRTNAPGVSRENQNFALRLTGAGGAAHVSFLFRDAENRSDADFHRWTSEAGFAADGEWHHVAVVYTFGKPETIRAYVDGEESRGRWDMGGATTEPPVVDDDELWIGSSLGGNIGNTFHGLIDEVAIYCTPVAADRLKARYQAAALSSRAAELASADDVPADRVLVQVFEGFGNKDAWPARLNHESTRYTLGTFALIGLPKKYTATGVIDDRSNPLLVRARGRLKHEGDSARGYEFLLRAKGAARLYVDGKLIAQTGFLNRNSSGHEEVPDIEASTREDLRPLPPGCQEKLAAIELEPGEHLVRLDAIVGGKGVRLELDELCVAVAPAGEPLRLVAPAGPPVAVDDAAWLAHRADLQAELDAMDQRNRRAAAEKWVAYWNQRHEYARHVIQQLPPLAVPEVAESIPVLNEIDRFLGARFESAGVEIAPVIDDLSFLRRVTLDTVGVVPTRREIEHYMADDAATRRVRAIDRLLDDPRVADHWVSYWQDVLAENPGILKPELNNSGPFRWWIHESLVDNKPFDQFATELTLMEGSVYYGGPAGFGLATQNDAPFAAKAHVLAKAFLAMDMHCARCHDAPYHPFKQEELFGLAAMLHRQPIKLPATSTVPVTPGARQPLVTISLTPGQEIKPAWPNEHSPPGDLPGELIRNKEDSREQVAIQLTSPHNLRFAQVLVNRVWQRLMGRGLVDPVDDWESANGKAAHPELLEFLAREFVSQNYDVRQLMRRILNSHAYQRPIAGVSNTPEAEEPAALFTRSHRRRVTAEQLVDSLFAISGKEFGAELLTLDPEGRRSVDTFLNLGTPRRAWQFTSLSNERDRPALALPVSQSIVDLLVTFGWRDARPNPVTYREEEPTALQPLTLANGVAANRAVRLSDDSEWTELSLRDMPVEQLVDEMFLRVFTRFPDEEERRLFVATLSEGYELRRTGDTARQPRDNKLLRHAVSWSNHLSGEATRIKQELERAVRAGDPPTNRLQSQWRERMEDSLWAMFNSPEFLFVP